MTPSCFPGRSYTNMVFIFHKPEKSNTNLVFMFHTCFQMSFMFEATSCLPRTSQCSNKRGFQNQSYLPAVILLKMTVLMRVSLTVIWPAALHPSPADLFWVKIAPPDPKFCQLSCARSFSIRCMNAYFQIFCFIFKCVSLRVIQMSVSHSLWCIDLEPCCSN